MACPTNFPKMQWMTLGLVWYPILDAKLKLNGFPLIFGSLNIKLCKGTNSNGLRLYRVSLTGLRQNLIVNA